MKKPATQSIECYKSFYDRYSFIQINVYLMYYFEFLSEDKFEITESLQWIQERADHDAHEAYSSLALLFDGDDKANEFLEYFSKRREESRGINAGNSPFSFLENIQKQSGGKSKEKMPSFFFDVQEFLSLYSVFEDSIKAHLKAKNHIADNQDLKEAKIIQEILDYTSSRKPRFIECMKGKSCEVIATESDMTTLWAYYTHLRHLYAHSMGIVTPRFIENIEGKNLKARVELFERKRLSLYSEIPNLDSAINDDDPKSILNFDFKEDRLYVLSDWQLNLFRNFIIFTMECLEEIEVSPEVSP